MALLMVSTAAPSAFAQARSNVERDANTEVQLVSRTETVRPGETATLGVRFSVDPGWHIYWRNPGEPGMPPELTEVRLPTGFELDGGFLWPLPRTYHTEMFDMKLTNFVYDGDLVLPFHVRVPADAAPGPIDIEVKLEWQACDPESCVPGEARLTLQLMVDPGEPRTDARWAGLFDRAFASMARPADDGMLSAHRLPNGDVLLQVSGLVGADDSIGEVFFFPIPEGVINPSAEQRVTRDGDTIRLVLQRDVIRAERRQAVEELEGVLVVAFEGERGREGIEFHIPVAARAPADAAVLDGEGADRRLLYYALMAMIGGMILNLMPCVFPILSIKIMGFVRQAGEDRAKIRNHGFMFGLGVLVSFWVLAGILIALISLAESGGGMAADSEGWGFQLQNPWFVMALTMLMVAVGLNLAGVYEIGYGMMNAAARAAGKVEGGGYAGSFFTGVLATIIATPCTAPFMGAAIGWALTATALEAMVVFTALGAGMALPYVLLSAYPAWLEKLPKPGPWMETFKQIMAFPILATAVWLIWVFGNLTKGTDGMLWMLASLLILSFGLWVYGRWATPVRTPKVRRIAIAAMVLTILVSLLPVRAAIQEEKGLEWISFDDRMVQQLREEGHTIFVDFTADWCLTCKVNLGTSINREEVRRLVDELGVKMVKADWTRRDSTILAVLERYGRRGVPLYVVYGPGLDDGHEILPNVLTPGIVTDAIKRAHGATVATQ